MHESPVSSPIPSFPIPVNMSSRTLWVCDTNKAYSLKKLRGNTQIHGGIKQNKKCPWSGGKNVYGFARSLGSVLCPTLTVQGSSLNDKNSNPPFIWGWTIPTDSLHVNHKRQGLEFSQNLLEQYQMTTYPNIVYTGHSNFSGKALVIWAGLVVMGQYDQDDV